MVSSRMRPCDVLTAQAEYSVMPTKYRLSKTLTGSACHCERSGGPGGAPLPRGPRWGAAVGRRDVGEQREEKRPGCIFSPAARAAATCASTPSECSCAVAAPVANATAATKDTAYDLITDSLSH